MSCCGSCGGDDAKPTNEEDKNKESNEEANKTSEQDKKDK